MKKSLILKIILIISIIAIIIYSHVIYLSPLSPFISQSKVEDLAMNRFKVFFNKLPSSTSITLSPNGEEIRTELPRIDLDLFYVDNSYEENDNVWVVVIKHKSDPHLSFIVGVYSRSKIIILPDEVMVTVRGAGDTNHTIAMLPTFI